MCMSYFFSHGHFNWVLRFIDWLFLWLRDQFDIVNSLYFNKKKKDADLISGGLKIHPKLALIQKKEKLASGLSLRVRGTLS